MSFIIDYDSQHMDHDFGYMPHEELGELKMYSDRLPVPHTPADDRHDHIEKFEVFNTDEEHQGLLFFGVFWSLT
jgi:hypothetical protein